jgi:hypothetical protein
MLGHLSLECKKPGERDVEGKQPYCADRLFALDERKKKAEGTCSASDHTSTVTGS